MRRGSGLDYHLGEYATALDPASPQHILPRFGGSDLRILDVGCGIGQTLAAACPSMDRQLVGIDRDGEALAYGRERFPGIVFAAAQAEALPFSDRSFDCVVSRVTLPYTDLPRAVAEIHRVLDGGGLLWCTLHPLSKTLEQLRESVLKGSFKAILFRMLVLLNGLRFHVHSRVFRGRGRLSTESFQSVVGITRCLERAGFVDVKIDRSRRFLVTASKPGTPLPRARNQAVQPRIGATRHESADAV